MCDCTDLNLGAGGDQEPQERPPGPSWLPCLVLKDTLGTPVVIGFP